MAIHTHEHCGPSLTFALLAYAQYAPTTIRYTTTFVYSQRHSVNSSASVTFCSWIGEFIYRFNAFFVENRSR